MKNLKILFSVVTLLSLMVFTACEKQELLPKDQKVNNLEQVSQQVNPTAINVGAAPMATAPCIPIWSFGEYPFCMGSSFGLCEPGFPPNFPDWLGLNQAGGSGYVNSAGTLVFNFDQSNFSPEMVDDILTNQTLSVAHSVEFPEEIINPLYAVAGMEAPAGPFTMEAGDYPVDVEPVAGIIKVTITVHYEDWFGNTFDLEIIIYIEE